MSFLDLNNSNSWVSIALSSLTALTIFFLWKNTWYGISDLLSDVLSVPINAYLCWRYPIHAADGSGRSIPTCPYRWPNGQGDVAKFLEGTERNEEWRKQYGSVYRLWSGMNPEIVISDPEDIRTVFKDSNRHVKAPANNSGYLMQQLLGQCVGLINRDMWKNFRSATEGPFSATASGSYITLITSRTRSHFCDLKAQPDGRLPRNLLDPVQDLKMLPFWIIADIIYGGLCEAEQQELTTLIPLREGLWQRMIAGGATRFGWSKFLPGKANAELLEWKRRWALFNDEVANGSFAQAQFGRSASPIKDMYGAVRQGTITHEQLLQTIDEMLFANLDVTTGGVSWNVIFLAAHPASQVQLREEVAARRKLASEVPDAQKPLASADTFSSYLLSSSSLLSACILESARLRPLAAFSVPQSAPSSRTVGISSMRSGSAGFYIPEGTDFIVDTHALNMNEPLWGAEPEARLSYQPHRFLEQSRTELRYHYWRYGFGPRQCMGKYVADLIIRVLLVHLVEEYELRLRQEDSEAEWARNKDTWIVHPMMELMCKSRK